MEAFGINTRRFNEVFSKNLKDLMYKKDINQRELADALHVSSASVSDWCNGKKTPRMDKIDAMCKILNCNRHDLMMEKIGESEPDYAKQSYLEKEITFTEGDYQLIIKILQLDEAGRRLVDLVVDHELERVRAKK